MPVRNSHEQDQTERRAAGSGYVAPPAQNQTNGVRSHPPNFVERKAAQLFSFAGVGDFVEGKLMNCDQVIIKDKKTQQPKKVWQFTIFNREEKQGYKIIGTWDICSKLSRDDVGSNVRITFVGLDNSIVKNGTAMKVFEVLIEESHRQTQSAEITDEDIPF